MRSSSRRRRGARGRAAVPNRSVTPDASSLPADPTRRDPATIQGVIKRLEERRLIERSEDPDDRRRATLRLSAAGEALVTAMIPAGIAVTAATLAPLDTEECNTFLALLRRLT